MKDNKDFIEKIESEGSSDEAFFSFRCSEYDQDNEHIEANPAGLKRFAAFLLRIAYNLDPNKSENQDNTFPIDQSLTIKDRGWNFYYLHLIDKNKSEIGSIQDDSEPDSWQTKLFLAGCSVVFIVTVAAIIIGFVTMIKWMIN